MPSSAQEIAPAHSAADLTDRFAIFAPNPSGERHTIDYEIWDFALKSLVVSMGPSDRKAPLGVSPGLNTRIRAGHNSLYRVEGSMMAFSQLNGRAIDSFREYREDLERIANEIDIAALPRNEQLAFWFNLHNVAMVEQIAKNWPMRQPRSQEIGGVPLNDAKVITIRGIPMSMRDVRERIVYANWRDPRVIYGFWRGEIGSPALEREAFTGMNVNGLLSVKAQEFVNSLRGTEKRGKTLHVSTLYEEAQPFYFPDFQADTREHISEFANDAVMKFVEKTDTIKASIREHDIADLSGGRRDSIAQQDATPTWSAGARELLTQRRLKMDRFKRKKIPTVRVYFTPLVLPGDDPSKADVQ